MGCDTFLTADLKHDLYLEAREAGMNLLDAGHYSTEAVVCPVIAQWVRRRFPTFGWKWRKIRERFSNISKEKPCQVGAFCDRIATLKI